MAARAGMRSRWSNWKAPRRRAMRISGSSLALGRVIRACSWWSRRICQRRTPSTRAVARLRSGAGRALTDLRRSRSSEWDWPRSTAMRRSKAVLRAGEMVGTHSTQPRAGCERISMEEFGGRETLSAFELEFEQFEPGVFGAGCEETMVFDAELA